MELCEIKNKQFRNLLEDFLKFLKIKSYKDSSLVNYRRILAKIDIYMHENNIGEYSPHVGASYCGHYIKKYAVGSSRSAAIRCAVSRLNDYCLGKEYMIQRTSHTLPVLPNDYDSAIKAYEQYCRDIGNKENSVSVKCRNVYAFLASCQDYGCDCLGSLTPSCITSACLRLKNRDAWAVVRAFLRFLLSEDLVDVDYSTVVPHYKRGFKLPVNYSIEEIQKVEDAVDRDTATGKRDYAMLLLATRLGMRSGDIVLLCMDNINFRNKNITFVQQKTGKELQLPLLPEVEAALSDYLDNARPDVNQSRIFLRRNAPFQPVTTSVLRFETSRYFKAAGIDTAGKKHGPHSFRSSLATSMANDGVPYEAIRKILGHADPDAIKHYARLDVERLRVCAIAVPEPTGLFKGFLERGCGV